MLLGNLLVLLKLLRCLVEKLVSGLGCLTALTKVCVILLDILLLNERFLDLRLCRLGIMLLNRLVIITCFLLDLNDGSNHRDGEHVTEALLDTVPLIYLIRILNEHLCALNRHQMLLVVHPFHLSEELCDGVAGLGRDHEAPFSLLKRQMRVS